MRINRSEIVNLDCVDGFERNCYYIGKNPLYATGDYRQHMEGVFIKAAIKRGQKSLLILLSVSRLGRRPRQNSSDWTPCEHVSQMASRVRQGRPFIFQSRPLCPTLR